MTPQEARSHGMRIPELWPTSKIPLNEWETHLLSFDSDKAGPALTALARKQHWPPSIAEVMAAIKEWRPPRPPRDVIPLTEFDHIPDPDFAERTRLEPELIVTGLRHLDDLRAKMADLRARSPYRTHGPRRTHQPAPVLEQAAEQSVDEQVNA